MVLKFLKSSTNVNRALAKGLFALHKAAEAGRLACSERQRIVLAWPCYWYKSEATPSAHACYARRVRTRQDSCALKLRVQMMFSDFHMSLTRDHST